MNLARHSLLSFASHAIDPYNNEEQTEWLLNKRYEETEI